MEGVLRLTLGANLSLTFRRTQMPGLAHLLSIVRRSANPVRLLLKQDNRVIGNRAHAAFNRVHGKRKGGNSV